MVLFLRYGQSVSSTKQGREMATAESSTRANNARNRLKAQQTLDGMMLRAIFHRSESNITRLQTAERALQAPVLDSLWLWSAAWKAAILMIDCYAVIPAGEEESYMQTYAVHTLEEAAEGMMLDGNWDETVSKRAYELGAKTALHALNWARRDATA